MIGNKNDFENSKKKSSALPVFDPLPFLRIVGAFKDLKNFSSFGLWVRFASTPESLSEGAILGTGTRSNVLSDLVPVFTEELDGLDEPLLLIFFPITRFLRL